MVFIHTTLSECRKRPIELIYPPYRLSVREGCFLDAAEGTSGIDDKQIQDKMGSERGSERGGRTRFVDVN
jgi:hypothetical protein